MVIVSIPLLEDYQYPRLSSTQYSVLAWLLCRYLCWGTISTREYHPSSIQYWHGYYVDTSAGGLLVHGDIIHPVFSTSMVIVSIPLLGDYQFPGIFHPVFSTGMVIVSIPLLGDYQYPGVSSTQYSVLAWLLYRYLCCRTITTLVITHPVFSTGMVIVSIPLLGDYQYPGVSSIQYSVLAWLLCRYLCWGTISTRGYHPPSIQYQHGYCVDTSAGGLLVPGYLPPSIQYWHGYCVDTSAGGLLVPGGILHPVFSTGMVIVSIPLLSDYYYPGYHPPSIQYWHGYCVDTSAGGLLVPGVILHPVFSTAMVIVSIPLLGDYQYQRVLSTQYSVLAWLLCRYLYWRTISTRGYHPPSIQYWHGYCVDTCCWGTISTWLLWIPLLGGIGVSSTQYSVLAWLLCRYLCWGTISTRGYRPPRIQHWHSYCVDTSAVRTISTRGYPPPSIQYCNGYCVDTSSGGLLVPGGIIHPVFTTGMVIVSIPLLRDCQYTGYPPPSIQYCHDYCIDTSAERLLVPWGILHPVFSTAMVIVSIPLMGDYQYPGYHPPSIQYWHGYSVDTSARGLLAPGGIIHPVFSTGMVIVSIPLLGDYQYQGVSSTQYSVLAWLLCRYLCWRNISTRGYHPPSIQYWHGYCVNTSAGGLLVPGGIIHPVFSTGMVIVSIPLLGDYQYPGYHPPSIQYCHGYCVDTSARGLLVPGVSSTQYSVLPWLLCRYLCQGTISTRGILHPVFFTAMVIVSIPLLGDYQNAGYHPPSIQYWHDYCVDITARGLLVSGVSSTQYSVLTWLLCRYLCWRTISTLGYHPLSIQSWHGYCVDTSAGGLLVPGGIIHSVFSLGMVIVSIPLLGDYQYPGYHPPNIQY